MHPPMCFPQNVLFHMPIAKYTLHLQIIHKLIYFQLICVLLGKKPLLDAWFLQRERYPSDCNTVPKLPSYDSVKQKPWKYQVLQNKMLLHIGLNVFLWLALVSSNINSNTVDMIDLWNNGWIISAAFLQNWSDFIQYQYD